MNASIIHVRKTTAALTDRKNHSLSAKACINDSFRSIFHRKEASLLGVALMLLLMLHSFPAVAQLNSGTIFGSVTDPIHAMLPGAVVTATAPDIGMTRSTTTNSAGDFVLPNLPPGTYTITVEVSGFSKLSKSGVYLNAADKLSAGVFEMKVGGATAEVEVKADVAQMQLQANSGERSDTITSQQLNDVATNGRNVLDYMRLIPGVAGVGAFGASGTGGLDSYNINGTRANSHEFTLDGASNVDTGNNGGTHVTINTDAIAEVKVLTSSYQAEFGKASGGTIAVVSKGGTNEFHGGVHFFHRNDGMNATGWYLNHENQSKVLYRYNTEGFDIGGPIKGLPVGKDKAFFFFSGEFYQQLIPGGTNSYYVPTKLERQGNFSQSFNSSGVPLTIYQPGTTTPYNNNTISSGNLYTPMQTIMNLYAQPNVSSYGESQFSYNRIDSLSYDNPRKEFIARVDYQITPNERAFVRWIGNRQNSTSPMQTWNLYCMGVVQVGSGCKNSQPGFNLSADLTSTIKPNLLNEVSVGPSVYRSTWKSVNDGLSVGKNNISLPLLYPVSSTTSIPDVSYGGNGMNYPWSYFGASPWFQANTTINATDNLTWVKSQHTFKAGIFYQRSRKDQIAWGNSNGQFNFNNCATSNDPSSCDSSTGSPYASALLGEFQHFDQSSTRPIGYFRYNQLEFYAQDTWKVSQNLTLDFGMRFVWIPPQYDDKRQIALFAPSAYVRASGIQIDTNGNIIPNSGNPIEGMEFASDHTLPKGGWKSRGIMAEPRLGFAWSPFSNNKTVVRGGGGMSHDREQGNLVFNPTFNNPKNVTTPSITANTYLPIGSIATAQQDSAGLLSGIIGADREGKVPTVYSFSLGIQQEISHGFTLDVAYVGSLSRHLVTARDANTIPYGTTFTKAAQNPANFAGGVVPNVEPNLPSEYAAAGYSFSGQYAYPTPYLAPYWGYDQIEYYKFDGTSNYNSLQTSVQRRFGKDLTLGAVYTWSKAMTTSSADESMVDPFNPNRYSYNVATFDRRNVAAINYVYSLPGVAKHLGGPHWLGYMTDGYQISGVSNFMTGTPTWTPYWQQGSLLTGGRDWSKVAPAFLAIDKQGKVILPKIGQPSKGTPDRLREGGMQTWDVSLFKNFQLGKNGQRSIQLRCETFNLGNHSNHATKDFGANLNLPSYNSGTYTPESVSLDTNYKQPTSDFSQLGPGGARVIQLGAKLYF